MGAVSSACEGCFGGEKPTPQASKLNPKMHDDNRFEPTNETQGDDAEKIAPSESLKGGNSSAKKPGAGVNGKQKSDIEDKSKKLTIKDFDLIRVLGRGSFGKVFLVQKKSNKKYYALKTLKKEEILTRGHIENALTEKNVLQKAQHPFVVRLRYSFQNDTTLYLVMDFCPGGELYTQLKRRGRFDEETTRFYASETILSLEYLHEKLDIIYRDLNPENILLDANGHIKLTDFGLSKASKKSSSFCGTPEYLAPEILLEQGHDKAVDWWSFGCLIYELLAGVPPFSSRNRSQLFDNILNTDPMMPNYFSDDAQDLLSKLLVKNPSKRLGFNGAEEIKKHPFFSTVNWEDILHLNKRAPIVPTLTRPDDLRQTLTESI